MTNQDHLIWTSRVDYDDWRADLEVGIIQS